LGLASPFLATGMSYMYRNLGDARLDVIRSGMVIRDDGFPKELGPMTFIFTGGGNVTDGALHVFKCLPHEWVSPNDLKSLYESKSYDHRKVYGCQVHPQDYLVKKDGGVFDKIEYYSNPELYKSIFSEKIAPYARFILNGIFWDSHYPRLLSISEIKALSESNRLPLLTLSDVSCDINGSMEFMSKASTIDDPFYMYDPKENKVHSDPDGPGIQIMSIDNLPSEMPLEASEYFSESLYPFVSELVKGNYNHPVLQGAIITTANGKLAKQHTKLYDAIKKVVEGHGIQAKKHIAILGSGYVVAPVVDYLLKTQNYYITIGISNILTFKPVINYKRQKSWLGIELEFQRSH
jgi:alpha-aminoadipic semialdehyde synthase